MRKNLPPLDSLRILVACVQHGNFSRAAAELRITPTAVSQRIRGLEAQLGVTLFKRHGPSLTTTDRAIALGQSLDHALTLIRTAVDDCRRSKQPLRVTCAPTFAARWLVPRLSTYLMLDGADAIALDTTQVVLPTGRFDVAIRSGTGPWPGHAAAKLLVEQGTPMLSSQWLRRGSRLTVKQLLKIPLIADPRWTEWFKLAGMSNPKPEYLAARLPNYELEAQAAMQGIGAALLSPILFGDLLARGALIAPFSWVIEGPASYWLLWRKESAEPHFVRYLKSQFGVGKTGAE